MKRLFAVFLVVLACGVFARSADGNEQVLRVGTANASPALVNGRILSVDSTTIADLDGEWNAELDDMRSAFRRICSDTRSGSHPTPEQKRMMEEVSIPLKAHLNRVSEQMQQLERDVQESSQREAAEIAAVTPKGRKPNADEQLKIDQISARYAEQHQQKELQASRSAKSMAEVVKQLFGMSEQCLAAQK